MNVQETIASLKTKKERLESAIAMLESLDNGEETETAPLSRSERRHMSQAGREAISRAAKKRWAEWRKGHVAKKAAA